MKKIKLLLSFMIAVSIISIDTNQILINAEEVNTENVEENSEEIVSTEESEESNTNVIVEEDSEVFSEEKSKSSQDNEYVEDEVEKYIYDENANIIGVVSEEDVAFSEDNSPTTRSTRTYGLGYLDFFGSGSVVINVYQTADAISAYTYFNTGSSERVATLGESNGRIKIAINGMVGYIDKTQYTNNAKFYSASSISSSYSEYYTKNSGGDLLYTYGYYETVTTIVVGKAPTFLNTGTKYYSLDGIYFYTNRTTMLSNYSVGSIAGSMNSSNPFYNYYQYLPFRSTTKLNATDFKNFLTSKLNGSNLTTSVLNNDAAINQFFSSQDNVSVNAALEFSMAMLESGYGTSQIAREKNNLFGWGAVDSGPYAGAFKFANVAQGIDYHFNNAINTGYLDAVEDPRYFGGNVGNKNNGVNVRYASDPFWGMKIAGLYYSMDKMAGFKDYNYYKLAIQVKPASHMYFKGDIVYTSKSNANGFNVTNMPFLVIDDSNFKVSVMSDIGICNTGDQIFKMYIDNSTLQVSKKYYSCTPNTVHFGAQVKFSDDIVQVNRDRITYTGGSNVRIPGGGQPVEDRNKLMFVMYDNSQYINYSYYVDSDGGITSYYEYLPNTTVNNTAGRVVHEYDVDTGSGQITSSRVVENGVVTQHNEYYTGAYFRKHASKINYSFYVDANNVIKYADEFDSNGKRFKTYEYVSGTKYGEHSGSKIEYIFTHKSNGQLSYGIRYNSSGKMVNAYEYLNTTYGNHASKYRFVYSFDANENIVNALQYNSNKQVDRAFEFVPYTKYGAHNYKISYIYTIDPNTGKATDQAHLNSGQNIVKYVYYKVNPVYGQHLGSEISKVAFVNTSGYVTYVYEYKTNGGYEVTDYKNGIRPNDLNVGNINSMKINTFVVDSKGYVEYAQGYNSSGKISVYYEYKPYTRYGAHSRNIAYIFYTNTSTGDVAYGYKVTSNWTRIVKYEYAVGAKFGSHGPKLKKVTYLK